AAHTMPARAPGLVIEEASVQ
ncbi:lytic transglycosylase, partial [Burkholderia pseudomallei]